MHAADLNALSELLEQREEELRVRGVGFVPTTSCNWKHLRFLICM
jgi:hypothetical protein